MVNTTVPVMTGGNSLWMGLTKMPTSVATTPPTIMAPATADSPPPAGGDGLHAGQIGEADAAESPAVPRRTVPPMGKSCSSVDDGGHHQRRLDEEHPLGSGAGPRRGR